MLYVLGSTSMKAGIAPACDTASVVAISDCEIAMFDGGALLDYMDSHPDKGYQIMRHLFSSLIERVRMNNIRANTIMGFYKREASS